MTALATDAALEVEHVPWQCACHTATACCGNEEPPAMLTPVDGRLMHIVEPCKVVVG